MFQSKCQEGKDKKPELWMGVKRVKDIDSAA